MSINGRMDKYIEYINILEYDTVAEMNELHLSTTWVSLTKSILKLKSISKIIYYMMLFIYNSKTKLSYVLFNSNV